MKAPLLSLVVAHCVLAFEPTAPPRVAGAVVSDKDRFDGLIVQCSERTRLNPRLVKAVIATESQFYQRAVSARGARGLMQLMPATAREMGVSAERLTEPGPNIMAGTAYLQRLYGAARVQYGLKTTRLCDAPSWVQRRVIAAYNGGPRLLYRRQWPRQTRRYVEKVMRLSRRPDSAIRLYGAPKV